MRNVVHELQIAIHRCNMPIHIPEIRFEVSTGRYYIVLCVEFSTRFFSSLSSVINATFNTILFLLFASCWHNNLQYTSHSYSSFRWSFLILLPNNILLKEQFSCTCPHRIIGCTRITVTNPDYLSFFWEWYNSL